MRHTIRIEVNCNGWMTALNPWTLRDYKWSAQDDDAAHDLVENAKTIVKTLKARRASARDVSRPDDEYRIVDEPAE